MELDSSNCVVVGLTNSQALNDIQNKHKVAWVMMVAPGIAIVLCNPYDTNLGTLTLFITALDEYNKWWGTRHVTHGAYVFEKLLLSKYIMNEEIINKYL